MLSLSTATYAFSGTAMPTGLRADVKMFGGNYGPEETTKILENQPASFVIGGKGVPLPWTSDEISDKEGLKKLALKLNPAIGYYDPFNVGDSNKEVRTTPKIRIKE